MRPDHRGKCPRDSRVSPRILNPSDATSKPGAARAVRFHVGAPGVPTGEDGVFRSWSVQFHASPPDQAAPRIASARDPRPGHDAAYQRKGTQCECVITAVG